MAPAPAGSTASTQRSMRGSTASATSMAGCSPAFCAGASSRRPSPLAVVTGAGVLQSSSAPISSRSVDAGLIQIACPRAGAHPHRAHRADLSRRSRTRSARRSPQEDLRLILDNIGLPARTYNLAFTDGSTIGVNDGVYPDRARRWPCADGRRSSRSCARTLTAAFPDVLFYFQPADMVTQVLNFGVPTQIDVQVQGRDRENNKRLAALLQQRMANIPGLVDAHVQQELNAPEMYYTIDRTRAQELGLNMQEVVNNLNISLSSSEQVTPNFWTDPKNGIPYYLRRADAGVSDHQQEPSSTTRRSRAAPTRNGRQSPTCWAISPPQSASPCSRSTTSPTSSRSTMSMRSVQNQRSRQRGRGDPEDRRRAPAAAQARQPHRHSRPDREHARGLRQSDVGAACSLPSSSIC